MEMVEGKEECEEEGEKEERGVGGRGKKRKKASCYSAHQQGGLGERAAANLVIYRAG